MSVARSLERRLERLIDGMAGRVFSGRLHASEMASRLAREADFARFEHYTGPATGNYFQLLVHPRDLTVDPAELVARLSEEIADYLSEQGLRLEGPVSIHIETSPDVSPGTVVCHVEVRQGTPTPWARLVSEGASVDIGHNRSLIGRSPDADVVLAGDDVSRHHALLWRQGAKTWIKDLGSSNGTTIDGQPVGMEPVAIESGSVVAIAGHRFLFTVI